MDRASVGGRMTYHGHLGRGFCSGTGRPAPARSVTLRRSGPRAGNGPGMPVLRRDSRTSHDDTFAAPTNPAHKDCAAPTRRGNNKSQRLEEPQPWHPLRGLTVVNSAKKECLNLTNEPTMLLKTKDRENERSQTKPILSVENPCQDPVGDHRSPLQQKNPVVTSITN